jgi:signal transduction histidine kinase
LLTDPLTLASVGVVLFLLVAGSAWALLVGLRARQQGRALGAEHARVTALLQAAPALPMLVRADGQVECPQRLADWLGLSQPPRYLAELAGDGRGLSPMDLPGLTGDIQAAARAGKPFDRSVRPIGSERTVTLRGGRAPGEEGAAGAVLVWAADATDRETQITRLGDQAARLERAYEALTALIEVAPLPMWYRGPDLKLTMVNSAYVEAVEGADAADVITRGIELVEGQGAGGPLAGAEAARQSGRPSEAVLPATIGGKRRTLRVYDVPLATGGVAGFAIDIEDLEQARSGQKRFAEAQREMLDRLSAGVAQFGPDRSLVFSNQPFRRMFAMRTEWLADRPEFDRVLERMREADRLPEVRDFPGWKAERREWFYQTEGSTEEAWHLRGGTHLRVVAQPLPDGGLLLIFEDRTEQVQLASARDTLLRVRTATFDNLFEALGVFAGDGRLQLWNNRFRALWGMEEEFLAGHPRVDAFAEAAATRLSTPNRAALIPELVRSATHERQQRAGRVAFADGRHFEFAAVPLPDGNALFTMLDISDSRRAEKALRDRNRALEEADRLKTQFVANMSYELKTPLTSIGGFAEMLHGGYAGKLPKEASAYVEAILESVERLGLLIDDVLDLTQGDEEQTRVDVDVAETARAAVETVKPAALRKKLDLAVEIARSAGRVTGDPRRLREMVEHLLRHAIDSLPQGGRVLLHVDGGARAARVVVSDDGPGMDADAQARAFDRFAAPGIQPSGERALGLGLPLAKQFAEAHGGTVQLVSEPGAGTLITVELPRR